MRISTQNLGLKIFFKFFLYLIFETIFWQVGKKLPKIFIVIQWSKYGAIISPILIDVSFVLKKISNFEDHKKFTYNDTSNRIPNRNIIW